MDPDTAPAAPPTESTSDLRTAAMRALLREVTAAANAGKTTAALQLAEAYRHLDATNSCP